VSSKKSKKEPPYRCLNCGGKLKPKMPSCKRCRKPNPGFAAKVAAPPAFLAKGAGVNVVPMVRKAARPVCLNGHTGSRGQRCCTRCGEQFGISRLEREERVMKAAGIAPAGYWGAEAARESDPARRERARDAAFKAAGGQPDAEALARAWNFPDLRSAAMFCNSPEVKSYFMNAYYGTTGGAA
jgi:hypothetical protein